jgi:hypothetical protein
MVSPALYSELLVGAMMEPTGNALAGSVGPPPLVVTVRVAELLVALPKSFDTTQRNCEPLLVLEPVVK